MRFEYTEFGASQRMPRYFAENKAPGRAENRGFPAIPMVSGCGVVNLI
jgi:hypothetical protein